MSLHILEKLAATNPECEIWWDSSPLVYAGWKEKGAAAMLSGGRTLAQIADWVDADNINPQPKSGQQEYLENLVNRFV